jgi:PKD repeat protein
MDYAAEALYYAADNGAHIISCSWTADDSGGIRDAVDYFLASGGLIFKASGNESDEVLDYFATIPSECVVDVAATDQNDCKASFSKYGAGIDISSPGVNILSLHNSRENPEEDHVTYMDGTSMACPLAAAVAALIWSRNPTWSASQVVQQLFDSADNIYTRPCNSSYAGKLGAGRINAYNAVNTEPTPPLADFAAAPTAGCVPLAVSFSDQSMGDITSWNWDFGDGHFSTSQNPSHTYQTEGNYTVSLTIQGLGGSGAKTKVDYIAASAPPCADFTANIRNGAVPLTVAFTDLSIGNPTSWSWDFGDSIGASTEQNPTYTYNNAGKYTVSLAIAGPEGSDNKIKAGYINVFAPPVADFSANPQSGSAPLAVAFTDLSTGNPTSWSWDFGDGISASTQQNPTYTFSSGGAYSISLTVANPEGSDNKTSTDYITVYAPPVADFSASPLSGKPPLTVAFTDLSTGHPIPTSWSWDFGDGIGTSTARNPSYTYASWGVYTISLTAANSEGSDIKTKTNYITVYAPPGADFSGSPQSGPAPLTVSFTDLSTGNPFSWSWGFGDGNYSGGKNPTHSYNNAGVYTVSLFAVGPGGSDNETKSGYITVYGLPVAGFSASPLNASAPATVSFTDQSTGNPASWSWDFGDGIGASTARNPSYTYENAGVYSVSLTVANPAGSDNETKSGYITISLGPVANFSATPLNGAAPLSVSFTDQSTGNPTSWSWDFGDGISASTARNPVYTYNNAGVYSVSLTVANNDGSDNETKTGYISVSPVLGADFSGSPQSGPAPLTVSFTDLSTGNPYSWSWSFGDGSYSGGKNPTHTYNNAGVYTVYLFAVGAGWSDNETKIGYITVYAPLEN